MLNIEILNTKLDLIDNPNPSQLQQIQYLINNSFNCTALPKIDKHFILLVNNNIIGYSAIVNRTFSLNKYQIDLFLLGMFTIDTNYRNKGLGQKLLEYITSNSIIKNSNGLILNCGRNLISFYSKCGFIQISNNAVYIRNSKTIIDHDPVLIKTYRDNSILNTQYESVYFGSDF